MRSLVSRFECASSALETRSLARRTRRALWVAVATAVALHASLARVVVSGREERAAKPLTTQFVKRQPRLTKPLELKKKPRPRRRTVQREMVSVQARTRRQAASGRVRAVDLVRRLTSPSIAVSRRLGFRQSVVEPAALAQRLMGSKEVKRAVDMSLEMLDIDALDTGQYHAMVIQDPADKKNDRGFSLQYRDARYQVLSPSKAEVAVSHADVLANRNGIYATGIMHTDRIYIQLHKL